MFRLGFVDCDTSHVMEFSRRLNHCKIEAEQWVDGAVVVAAYPGRSAITDQKEIDTYVRTLQNEGVTIVDWPEDLLGRVDGVMVESIDGRVHRERALPFIDAGIPVYVDKPFATSTEDARAMTEAARRKGLALFSASSLRFALEVQQLHAQAEATGRVLGADAYSPAVLHPHNPGLFYYGVHGVETLYAVLGPGCHSVRCIFDQGAEVVIGRWADGRLGTVRGIRQGAHGFGFTAFCERRIVPATIDTRFIYRELLKQVVRMFITGQMPVSHDEMVEVVVFQEAALRSMEAAGNEVILPHEPSRSAIV